MCVVAAECVTAGFPSERKRLSDAAGTEPQQKDCAERLKKWTRSHLAWEALCGGKAAPTVYLAFMTNGTFGAAVREAARARPDVCLFDKDNAEALVLFAHALPLLRAPCGSDGDDGVAPDDQ